MLEIDGKRHKVGLALSGGGFRASIFHLGVLKRLRELAIYPKIDVVSTVSGGSIIGAFYVIEANRQISHPDIEKKFRQALKANVRLRSLTGAIAFHPVRFLRTILPGSSRTNTTGAEIDRILFRGVELQSLPDHPKLIINATSLNTGQVWKFSKELMGDYRHGTVISPALPVCDAVVASAAVPGLFPPLLLDPRHLQGLRAASIDPVTVKRLALSDGGIRDNQGITSLLSEKCSYLIVSDASGLIDARSDCSKLAAKVLLRASNITMDAARDLIVREIFGRKQQHNIRQIVFFDMEDKATEAPGLPSELRTLAANTRTDLDWFSDEEVETIAYHGYTLLDQKIHKYGRDLLGQQLTPLSWQIDYSQPGKVQKIKDAMRNSHKRRIRPHRFR